MQSTLHIYIENALKKYNMFHFLCLRLIKNVAIHNLNIKKVLCKSNASEMREIRSLFSRTFQRKFARKFERKFGAFRAKFRLNKAR